MNKLLLLLLFVSAPVSADVWTITAGVIEGKPMAIATHEKDAQGAICLVDMDTPHKKLCFILQPETARQATADISVVDTKIVHLVAE